MNTSTNAAETSVVDPPLPDEPYRGIEPFRFVDQQIFTAREDETWALLSNVMLYRAVLLYGASGTGKSSLINAGLLPRALKDNYVIDRIRVQPIAGREIKIERIKMSGDENESAYLPSSFAPPGSDASAESIELSLASFQSRLEDFRTDPEGAEPGTLFGAVTGPRPLLIFDQFEEFITLFEEARRVDAGAENGAMDQAGASQQEILTMLVDLIQDESLPVKIVFSFREDYLAKLSTLFDYCPDLLDQAQRLLPPNIEVLPQIIRAPFASVSLCAHFLKHGGSAGSELSESLAKKIGSELARRSEGGVANLTELQIVCQRLWQAPNPETLFTSAGIEGLLKEYGADVFRHFTPALRDAAVVLLSHMITASNTRNIISEEDLLSRTGECNFQPSQCTDALAALASSQIVRREPRHSIYFYEITSEYLVPWIKERVAERHSAEERRLAEVEKQKLEADRAQAVENYEAQRRRARVMMWLATAMGLLMIAAVALGVVARSQHNRAEAARGEAKAAREQSDQILTTLKLVTSQNPEEILRGIEQFDIFVKERKIPADLAVAAIRPAIDNRDPKVHLTAYEFLLRAAANDPTLNSSVVNAAKTDESLAEKIPPRFFIHISEESQRSLAQQLATLLKNKGYLVQSIQNVGEQNIKVNQLRYFRKSDPGFPRPSEIVKLLEGTQLGTWTPVLFSSYADKVPPGQFELWFASPEGARSADSLSPKAARAQEASAANALNQLVQSLASSDEEEKAAALEKVRAIVAALEGDGEIAPMLKLSRISSTMTNGARLVRQLKAIKSSLATDAYRQNIVNQAILANVR
jgi:hypothetical protein